MAGMTLSELLKKMIEMGGSDLHITTNSAPRVRVHGKLRPLDMPPLTAADTKSLSAISAEMKDISARARDKKLAPADYQGGSSAISNLGMYGVREFSAIINPPHATILAVGAAAILLFALLVSSGTTLGAHGIDIHWKGF